MHTDISLAFLILFFLRKEANSDQRKKKKMSAPPRCPDNAVYNRQFTTRGIYYPSQHTPSGLMPCAFGGDGSRYVGPKAGPKEAQAARARQREAEARYRALTARTRCNC